MLVRMSVILILISMFFNLGCNDGRDPVRTDPQVDLSVQTSSSARSSRILWSVHEVAVNFETQTLELVQSRNAMFTCNVTNFMQPPMSQGQKIGIEIDPGLTDWDTGYIVCDVTLNHPFPSEKKFRGFDVRGIVMGDGSLSLTHDPDILYAGQDDLRLLNPDGFTRWWNPTEFTTYGELFGYIQGDFATPDYLPNATLNAYKYFADELGPNEQVELDPVNRGTFSTSPGVNTRRYILQFPMPYSEPVFNFSYAVDASWSDPDPSDAPYYPIESFGPDANCAEPYMVTVTDIGSTAWYVNASNKGGSLVLDVEVFDWQALVNPDGVTGEISALWLDGDIVNAPVNLLENASELPGGPTSSIFRVEVNDLNLTHPGLYDVWLIAESTDPDTYEPNIPHDTSSYAWPNGTLASYFTATIEVSGLEPQVAPTVIDITPEVGILNTSVPATVDGSHFMDGCQVELRESIPIEPAVIYADNESVYADNTKIACDLDLTSVPTGLYDVVVINPDTLEASLEEGFEVTSEGYIIYVDSSNTSGIEDGSETWPYSNIPVAINAANPGCSVWVDDSGSPYVGQVMMKPDVDLISVNWDGSDGDEEASITVGIGFNTCVLGADDSRIEGFEINGINGFWHATYGIVCNGTSPEISDCHVQSFRNPGACGIYIRNGAFPALEYVEVNDINNNTYNLASTFYGINIEDCDSSGDERVTISHTIVHDVYSSGFYDGPYCQPTGINIDDSDGVLITNSIIYSITGGFNNQVSGITKPRGAKASV